MFTLYDLNSPKKSTRVSINSDLLKQAKDSHINLSSVLEQALARQLKAKKIQLWQEQNKQAIVAYNKADDEIGIFSNGLRGFYY